MNRNEETHKIYGYVTEDEFYAGLNEAKKENLFVDEKGWVDIGALLSAMWKVFGEGRMVVVPKEGFKRPEVKPENEECHCTHCEVERDREKNRNSEGFSVQEEFIEETPNVENAAMDFVEEVPAPKKRPSRSKKVKEETAETVTE
jgi:hypothetical protein